MLDPNISSPASLPVEGDIDTALSAFSRHGLSDLSNSSLMNRVDSKFLLPTSSLIDVINACQDDYSLLEINGLTKFIYENLYFDSPSLNLYHHHHNRKLNRFKVRHRHYADVGTSYLEVKFKNNKGRTIKNRCLSVRDPIAALENNHDFLEGHGVPKTQELIALQNCTYQRVSLANEKRGERITFDLGVTFSDAKISSSQKNPYQLSNYFIAELKQSTLDRESPFYRLMREMSVRPKGFSKYCMGVALTHTQPIKKNRFKANILRLQKGA